VPPIDRLRLLAEIDPTDVESRTCADLISSVHPSEEIITEVSKEQGMTDYFGLEGVQLPHDLIITEFQHVKGFFTIFTRRKTAQESRSWKWFQEVV
jgi:hypothetical protein